MWLTLMLSPVSGSGIRQSSACSCGRSTTPASVRAAPASAGWSVTSSILSSPSHSSRVVFLNPSRNSSPVLAPMAPPVRRHRIGGYLLAMPIDSLTARWRAGRTTLGAWVMLRDPLIAEAAATAGYDYVGLDLQHGLEDMAGALAMLQAMARTPAVPIVRV